VTTKLPSSQFQRWPAFCKMSCRKGWGTAWLSCAHSITLSTVALQSDIDTRWISANGTLVNLLFGIIFWLSLKGRYRPTAQYFLILAMAGNLFTGTGYFLFSGVLNFGDWAAVITDLHPHWLWRAILISVGAISYYAAMLIVRSQLNPFQGREPGSGRIRMLCWIPYFSDGVFAGIGGLFNPAGLFYVVASALPSTLGANAGLLSLPSMMQKPPSSEDAGAIQRNLWVIAAGSLASILFVFVLGRGITFSR
jgi:hypothetical protein